MNLARFQIKVTNRAGTTTCLIGAGSQAHALLSADFDLLDNIGCNEFSMRVSKRLLNGTILPGYLLTVSAQPTGGAFVDYWTGSVVYVPKAPDTREEWEIQARGLWFELARQRVVKFYESKPVDDLATDILAEFDSPVTAISSSTAGIVIASPYTIGDVESEFDSVTDLIEQMAIMQNNVQFGVDQSKVFYFKDTDNAVATNRVYVVGKHVWSFQRDDSLDELVNDVYVQSKHAVGGGLLTQNKQDSTSQTAYGRSTLVVQLRNTGEASDVARYCDNIIARQKDPRRIVQADLPAFSDFLFPRGQAKIIDAAGTAENFPIKRVKYQFDGEKGLTGAMEIGDRVEGTIDEKFLEMMRRIDRTNSGALSLVKNVHTRGEEFAQRAISDARRNGLFNTFFDTLGDIKSFDKALSSHIEHRGEFIMGPFEFLAMLGYSNPVPTGHEVDDVRFYCDLDYFGRINFDRDSDWPSYFEENVADWRQNEDGLGLEQFQNSVARLMYRDQNQDLPTGQTGFAIFPPQEIRFLYRHDPGATIAQRLYWLLNLSIGNYMFAEIDNTSGTQTTVALKMFDGGVTTTKETITGLDPDTDYIIEAIYAGAVTHNHKIRVLDVDGNLIDETASYSESLNSGRRVAFSHFVTGGVHQARIGWFEMNNDQGNILANIRVSRDGGATYTSDYNANGQGFQFHDFDVSSHGAGTNIVTRIRLRHPVRMFGWGLAWGAS